MKLLSVSSLLLALTIIIASVSSSPTPDTPSLVDDSAADSEEFAQWDEPTAIDDISVHQSLPKGVTEKSLRVRRSCDCRRQSGECVAYGTYQCSTRRNAVVVQCLGYKWVRIGACPNSCKVLSNNQPYCF